MGWASPMIPPSGSRIILASADHRISVPTMRQAQAKMKQVCSQCHTPDVIDRVYDQAEKSCKRPISVSAAAKAIVDGLRADGLLKGPPFSHPIDFLYFDFWHYDGRT